jgi:hypothetical protein
MKKTGKVILIIIAVILVLQVAVIAWLYLAKRVSPNTVLSIRIEGEVPEQPPDSLRDLLTGPATTVTDIT